MAAVLLNPAVLALVENLAITGASLWAQSQDAKTANDIGKLIALAPTITSVAAIYSETIDTLQQAQSENWTADDARWDPVFAKADAALAAAEGRLT